MAKLTVLEMVQSILNDMDSDTVNSIDDTVESQQVTSIIKDCYNEMISNRNWPHLRKLCQLESINDLTKPTHLKLAEGTKELVFFRYDKHRVYNSSKLIYEDVRYKEPDAFLRMVSGRNTENENVETVVDFSGTKILVNTNQPPMYWTTFDDQYIVCDSYDADVDDTLKESKTQCLAYIETPWEGLNDSVPNLPSEAFSALLAEAKSLAFFTLKQMVNSKAEATSQRQQRWLSRKAWAAEGGIKFANFGRKARR